MEAPAGASPSPEGAKLAAEIMEREGQRRLCVSFDPFLGRLRIVGRQQHLTAPGDLLRCTVEFPQQQQQQQQQQQDESLAAAATGTATGDITWEFDLSRNFLTEFDWSVTMEALGALGILKGPQGGPLQLAADRLWGLCLTANELNHLPRFHPGTPLHGLRELRLNYNKIESFLYNRSSSKSNSNSNSSSSSSSSSSSKGAGEEGEFVAALPQLEIMDLKYNRLTSIKGLHCLLNKHPTLKKYANGFLLLAEGFPSPLSHACPSYSFFVPCCCYCCRFIDVLR